MKMSMQVDGIPARVAVLAGHDPAAVETVLRALPSTSKTALIVMCIGHTAETLRQASTRPVVEVRDRASLEPDRVYVIPGELSAAIVGGELVMVAPVAAAGAPIDRLLRSLADSFGPTSIAVILAGQGADGAIGIKRLKEAGGLTIVQEPDTLLLDPEAEMRQAAIATGMADLVLPLPAIAERLGALAESEPAPAVVAEADHAGHVVSSPITDVVRDILSMVRVRTGHDFSLYKRATVYRRIARRMQVCQTDAITDYQRHLREHPGELSHLLRDFLISVTSFFRDAQAFTALSTTVIPRLFVAGDRETQVRVWVAGCATGEEAYSVAMLLVEHASRIGDPRPIQVFATDIDERSLAAARSGRYPETIASDVSPERLDRFFTREPNHYRIRKELRERVLFSPHNVLRDPPFSRLDLVTCRNLLIYLNREAQDRVLNMFHFGLRTDGFLFLGSAEAAETTSNQFRMLDGKHQLYQRCSIPSGTLAIDVVPISGKWTPPPHAVSPPPIAERSHSFGELHHRLVEHYAPPSLLVNDELEIVHVSEHAGKYLVYGGGEPTRQLLRLVRPELRTELRAAIYAARQRTTATETRAVQFDDRGVTRQLELRVRALESDNAGRHMLVLFEEIDPSQEREVRTADTSMEPVVRQLEDDLHRTREQLRSTIEQYETSLEELKASNEELQASNEELRSASEELETGKEELQSINEELTTVNQELKFKVDEVSHTNSDLQNLMMSTDIAVLFLDRALAVKRFTPRAKDLFNLIPSDIGRPLAHVTHCLDRQDLPELAETVLQQLRPIVREVSRTDGRRYLVRIVPYRSLEDRIDGVVMTFADVTDLKDAIEGRTRSEAALHVTSQRLRIALRNAPIMIVVLDAAGGPVWSYAFGVELGAEPARALALFAPGHGERFHQAAVEVQQAGQRRRVELELVVDGQPLTYEFWIDPSDGGTTAVGFDITASKLAEASLLDADRRKDEFLATLSHELRNPLTPLKVALEVASLAEDDPELQRKTRRIIERQADLLTKLVDDLLDLSRITHDKLTLEREVLDPVTLVEAALEIMRPELLAHRHELRVVLPRNECRILGDHARLVQVLCNLLGNAIKYTPDGGQIVLDVQPDLTRGVLVGCVRDNGVGIAPEALESVFELFVQSRDSLGRAAGGLGIGLNLVRRLVDLHGGTVAATSAGPGEGSEFTFELPLVKGKP